MADVRSIVHRNRQITEQYAKNLMALLNCIVVTPEKTAVESKAEFLVLPLYDGEIGIAPGRAPLIGRLGYGEMRLTASGTTTRYYLDGGFVQVAGDVVSVLTNRAVLASDVDAQVAAKQLQTALTLPTATAEMEEIRDRQLAQARAAACGWARLMPQPRHSGIRCPTARDDPSAEPIPAAVHSATAPHRLR